jgi:uncharacterized protein
MAYIEIRRFGSYTKPDQQGFLQGSACTQKITGKWLSAVKTVTQAYLDACGDDIHSIYIRGSIAKGLALEHVSDIDSFAVLNPGCKRPFTDSEFGIWIRTVGQGIQKAFPFIAGVELDFESFEAVQDRANIYTFIIKVEGACVQGEDLAQEIEPYRLNSEIAFQTRYFRHHLNIFLSEYPEEPEHEKPSFLCWITRRFLRLGMELVMIEELSYTRDLYLCYESFIKHYPEKATEMYRALEIAINPTVDEATEVFIERFGSWLAKQAEQRLAVWGYVQQ